jgi:hypothetical protein
MCNEHARCTKIHRQHLQLFIQALALLPTKFLAPAPLQAARISSSPANAPPGSPHLRSSHVSPTRGPYAPEHHFLRRNKPLHRRSATARARIAVIDLRPCFISAEALLAIASPQGKEATSFSSSRIRDAQCRLRRATCAPTAAGRGAVQP